MTEAAVLGEVDARALTDQIRNRIRAIQNQVDRLGDLIIEAYNARAWQTLGYADWAEYVTAEFGSSTRLRLDRDERRELVVSLRSAGLSTRAIGSALATSKSQVDRDLGATGVPSGTATPITGLDGKTYTSGPAGVQSETEPLACRQTETADTEETSDDGARSVSALGGRPLENIRYRRSFHSALARAGDVLRFDPARLAEVLDEDQVAGVERLRDEVDELAAGIRERRRGLRLVQGGRP